MRVEITLRDAARKKQAIAFIERAGVGVRVAFSDPALTTPQHKKLRVMLAEISAQVCWHGKYLSEADWFTMLTASLRGSEVVDGIDEGTRVPLGLHIHDIGELSRDEASNLIELAAKFGAEQDVEFREPENV